MLGSANTEPGGNHDETSSSAGNGKDDDDALGSDDESDDRLDPQQHDPERLKAFNVGLIILYNINTFKHGIVTAALDSKDIAVIDNNSNSQLYLYFYIDIYLFDLRSSLKGTPPSAITIV